MLNNPDDELVLIIAPIGRDAQLLQTVLTKAGFFCSTVQDSNALRVYIQQGIGALLLTEEALISAGLQELRALLTMQPEWSNLPLVLLVDESTHPKMRKVTSEILGPDKKITILERPVSTKTLIEVMQATLWVRRRQYQARDLLNQLAIQNAALAREVAERQRTELALRESDERLRAALVASATGTFRWNLSTNILQWDTALAQLFGLPPDQTTLTLDQFVALVAPDDRAEMVQRIQRCIETGADFEMEFRVIWPDGSLHWLYDRGKILEWADGHPLDMTGACTDITTFKQTEAELDASQRLTQSIIDTSPTVIYIYDLHLRQTVYMSAQAAGVLGYTDDDLTTFRTGTPMEFMHPDDQIKRDHYFQRFELAGDHEILEIEYRMRHKNGEWRWFVSRDKIFQRTDAGQPLALLGVALDITTRKQAEQSLQDLNTVLEQRVWERTAELERSNRELDQFAYVASHDLKAPLRAINYLAEWIRTDAADSLPSASQTHLATLQGRIKRMEALLNDLLAYSRAGRQRHALEPVDTTLLVKDVIDLLAPPQGFTITVESNLPVLPLERVPLETVLRNLIGNAIKHHDRPDIGRVSIAAQEQAQLIEFAVSDNGPGIDPAFHERIFQIFQTLKARDEVEGSGMGLAVVKKTVEYRGGTIQVESSVGQGATFRFTWPKEATQSVIPS
ncbi:hypothetical protein BH10CHL1_BH10CHL1_07830 [soil metagenome]